MLYLAIDQHRKQLTVNLRNEQGDVVLKRQVSTEWLRVRKFLEEVQKQSQTEGGFIAILEVCGFNDWLLKLLVEYGCRQTILIQPEKRSKKKTDRRDANSLGEILWVNRNRLLAGKKVQGIRRVQPPCERDAEDRQITALRKRLGQLRTRTINKIKHLLRRDPWMKAWYGRIKKRRGSKIARVAVMRRLATIIWQMVKHNEPYTIGGPPRRKLKVQAA